MRHKHFTRWSMLVFIFVMAGPSLLYSAADTVVVGDEPESAARTTGFKPVRSIAEGLTAPGRGAVGLLSKTVAGTKKDHVPVIGTVNGVLAGSKTLIDETVKGAYKAATLGLGDPETYQFEAPEKNPDDFGQHPSDTGASKFKFRF